MIATTLRIARGTVGRLLAAGLAVALGAGFVAAVLIGGNLLEPTASDNLAAPYVGADLVVAAGDGAVLDDGAVRRLALIPGVDAAQGLSDAFVEVRAAARSQYVSVGQTSDAPSLRREVEQGVLPTGPGQVALPGVVAERLRAGLGSTVVVRSYGGGAPQDTQVTVVGLFPDSSFGTSR